MRKALFISSSFLFMLMLSITSYAQSDSLSDKGERYVDSDEQMQEIDQLLEKAKANNKLALIIMGANWCHDSRSLAKKLYLPEVKPIIDNHYELLFVDVGYFTKVERVITRFGMPVIYATPTVLIIDPETGQRVNGHNMHLWRSADLVSVQDTAKYFSDMANQSKMSLSAPIFDDAQKEQLENMNQLINDFEKTQSKRIYKAFSIIGPLLKEKKEGGKAENFGKYWKAVAALRYKITDDLTSLRKQAIKLSKANSKETLLFPKYSAFEWE